MILAVVALVGLLVTLAATVLRPGRAVAWLLLGFTALWLPANDHHLEGAILVDLGGYHGITTADLLAVLGAAVAGITLLVQTHRRSGRDLPRLAGTAALCAGILVIALAVTYGNG